jgi:hypothetical protein
VRTSCNDNTPDGFTKERHNRSWFFWVVLAISMVAATGCSASVRVRPNIAGYAVAPVGAPPIAIEGYPRYFYGDRYAYLVDGQWYYPTPDGWVVFLDVPPVLTEYRLRVQSAPPAARPPDVYYGYPPPPPTPPRELKREYRPE